MRIVHYIADAHGFRATITSNEPGVDTSQSPAATALTSPGYGKPWLFANPELNPSLILAAHAPLVAAPVHASPLAMSHTAIAPVAVHKGYEPVYQSAPVAPAYTPVISKPYSGYHSSPLLASHYTPALSAPLMASAYANDHSPILKSAYVPTLTSAKVSYSEPVVPLVPNDGLFGRRTGYYRPNPYAGFY